MKVLLVISSYLPNVGGLQSVTSTLARGLREQGAQIHIVAPRYPRTLAAYEVIEDVPVQRLHFLEPRWSSIIHRRFDLFAAGLIFFPLTLVRLAWLLARERYDVVNLHFVGAPALFLWLARFVAPFRYVVSLHGDDVEGLARRSAFDRWVFRATLRAADAVTACSRFLLDEALIIEPQAASRAQVIHNGAEFQVMGSENAEHGSEKYIVGVGRLVPSKGWDVLVRALVLNARAGHSFCVKLVGDGPERASLQELARELELKNDLEWLGAHPHESVMRVMANAQFGVMPSRRDSFGLAALEMMMCGKPVVAANVGGLREVLQDADAYLVEPENPDALAQALCAVVARVENEPTFGARNRELAQKFSAAHMTAEYVTLYQELMAR